MSTRPRITFDESGKCNACQWKETKKSINWEVRSNQLKIILESQKKKKKPFDCLVPVSGGKDGSYVSYMVKEKYNLNPLCVTIAPPLPLKIGDDNLKNFVASGFDHLLVTPSKTGMTKLNKMGFVQIGFPYFGWQTAISTAIIKIAQQYDIELIIYGEDGEVEYGGSTETISNPFYTPDYQKRVYLEGGYNKIIEDSKLSQTELFFFTFPKNVNNIKLMHWSYFENWDPYRNYLVAKEHCGLKEGESTNAGTFTNFAQTDQALYPLHAYLMFLKFGFGRANQDSCIEIRRGAMEREQGLNLVKLYDGHFPEELLETYLDYYSMNEIEFFEVLDKWANKDILIKEGRYWKPNFEIV